MSWSAIALIRTLALTSGGWTPAGAGNPGPIRAMRQDVWMADEPQIRSVKIREDERRGWTTDRPRRDGAPPRLPTSRSAAGC